MSEADRIAATRLMLLKLGLAGGDPRWSSAVLGSLVDAVLAAPGGSLDDLMIALDELLGRSELSETVAHFIKELVILCFTRHRSCYDSIDWPGLPRRASGERSEARCFFLAHALPPHSFPADLADAVARGLGPTPFREIACDLLPA